MRSIPRFAALGAALTFAPAALAELFWVEAEDVSEKTLEGAVAGWGNAEVLSGGKWFFGNIEEGQVLEKVPEEGLILKYAKLFSVQWNNPTPEKPIKEVVLRLGRHGDWFGQPILLGVTAAELKGN